MGNYRCYNCNQEFVFLGSLKKHYDKKQCPKSAEPTEEMLKPFFRVLIQVSYVNPKKLNAEKFQYSHNITTQNKNYKNDLFETVNRICFSLQSKSEPLIKLDLLEQENINIINNNIRLQKVKNELKLIVNEWDYIKMCKSDQDLLKDVKKALVMCN